MSKPFVYVVYDRNYHKTGWFKKVYTSHTWISSVGVFSGNINDLLDHYCYNSVATFECLIPEIEMEEYITDLRNNHKYEYDKFINIMIDISSSNKYYGYEEYLLNKYCLSKINNW